MGMMLRRHRKVSKPEQAPEASPKQDVEYPLHIGGGYYELSNGDKVQGKKEAQKAEKEL